MSEQPLEQKVHDWLRTQGYDVEMRVANELNASGFQVSQSLYYSDPETGNSREIDVVGRTDDVIGLITVYSVIECKKSAKPWIVFTSQRTSYNRVHAFAIMTKRAREAVAHHVIDLLEIDWFKKPERLGYGVTEAFTSKEDNTFKGGMTATKAAISLLTPSRGGESDKFLAFAFPTVVLDGNLFECYLDDNNETVVVETDSTFLLFPVGIGEQRGASVQVVTMEAFSRYCKELQHTFELLKLKLHDHLELAADEIGIRFDKAAMRWLPKNKQV